MPKHKKQSCNFDFLAVNMRLHGPESPNPLATLRTRVNTMGWKEAFDVVGAINYLASKGYKEIVVYGHSMGGAAVINAIGLHKDKISANIEIKGVIVEKTWASTHDFFYRLHQKWMSNFGVEAYRGLLGTSYSDINLIQRVPPVFDWWEK
ncbi:alpha/beta hydrolase [Candidatus Woesearchaeota archaeon]|nr:alpha/beta hydrolase [Candidatus Woesearchaeota archaeon]